MFRIRYSLMAIFGVIALAPLLVFGFWAQSVALEREFEEVQDRHLLLARNLGAALNRYHRDVSSTIEFLAGNLIAGQPLIDVGPTLGNLNIQSVCVYELATGKLFAGASGTQSRCEDRVPADRFSSFKSMVANQRVHFSEVMAAPDGHNVICVLLRRGDKLVVSPVSTEYIAALGASVSFGVKGHAAIVDHKGNVLAHPLKSWVAARENISKVSAVQRMLNGETGIEQFYSPALKGDMIAGFTAVDGPGWGVMIPQPIAELYAKAASNRSTGLTVLIISLLAVAGLSIAVSLFLAHPIEKLIAATKKARQTGLLAESEARQSALVPVELFHLQHSFNAMVRDIRANHTRIKALAYTDPVTGILNREAFQIQASAQMELLRQGGSNGAMIFVDLDEFKAVNDTLGHDGGDQLLRDMAGRLEKSVELATGHKPLSRPRIEELSEVQDINTPVIGRVGGDEFTVFIPDPDNRMELAELLECIRAELSNPLSELAGHEIGGASLGAAVFPRDGDTYESVVRLADIAMYHAKRSGKNCSEIYRDEIGDVTAAEIRRDFQLALVRNELELHYQPKVSARGGKVNGVEALVRWNHPVRGFLMPGEFIEVIENCDLAVDLGEWVLKHASGQVRRWMAKGIDLKVAVNIATRHFGSSGFVERTGQIIQEQMIDPTRIELEITEETVLASLESAQSIIRSLQDTGVQISLDDFGRGYSNLARLANLSVDTIKIDCPLIARICEEKRTRVIVQSTIDMARGLGCRTVAEGVETRQQAELLANLGCAELQGYYFARPMSARKLQNWIAKNHTNQVHVMHQELEKLTG